MLNQGHILAVATPIPTPSPTESAAAVTLDTFSLLWRTVLGLSIGLVLALAVVIAVHVAGRRSLLWHHVGDKGRNSFYALFAIVGALIGAQLAMEGTSSPAWYRYAILLLVILFKAALTWVCVSWVKAISATVVAHAESRNDPTNVRRANKITTQAQILRRVAEVIVIIIGAITIVMTFPQARLAMGSLLASAGLVSVVAGLAAQSVLGNLFAGVQLAITDAIRVDDQVVINATDSGRIEEITFTYVVVLAADGRRILLPSKYFTENPFTNWSRRDERQTAQINFDLDWRAPIAAMRAQLAKFVASSSTWDGRDAALSVIDAQNSLIRVRLTVSAANSVDAFKLQCHVREEMVTWLQKEAPYALPRQRVEVENVTVMQDPTPEKVAKLAQELAQLSSDTKSQPAVTKAEQGDPIEEARVQAAAVRSKKMRRRRILRRGLLPGVQTGSEATNAPEPATMVLSDPTQVAQISAIEEAKRQLRPEQARGVLSAASRSAKAKVEALRSGAAEVGRSGAAPDAVAAGSTGAGAKVTQAPGAISTQAPGAISTQATDAEAGINEVDKTAVLPAVSDKTKDES